MKEFSGSSGFPCYSGAKEYLETTMRDKMRKNVFQVEKKLKKSTVRAIIRKWKTYKTSDNLPRSGGPRKISSHGVKMIMKT